MEKENSLAFAFMSMLSLAGMGLYVYNNSADDDSKNKEGFVHEESDDDSLGSEDGSEDGSDDDSEDDSEDDQPKKKQTRKKK